MKKFVLAALAAFSIVSSIGTAYAAHPTVYRNGVEIWGPAETTNATGG